MSIMWRQTDSLSVEERLSVLSLFNRIEATSQREAIDEARRRRVIHGLQARHWLGLSSTGLVAYAQAEGEQHTVVELAGGGFDEQLCDAILQQAGTVDWWLRNVVEPPPGTATVRELQLLGVALPTNEPFDVGEVTVRPFQRGRDEEVWLAQNNRAFATHPEQGAWSFDDLESRANEPWFDPSGFLLLFRGADLVASCWTKIHELAPERIGEIYVISVDPAAQGRGLGRLAVVAGLRSLSERGVQHGTLFVDRTNHSALKLYESLGFVRERTDLLVRCVLS
jgi:mycothiol synthase